MAFAVMAADAEGAIKVAHAVLSGGFGAAALGGLLALSAYLRLRRLNRLAGLPAEAEAVVVRTDNDGRAFIRFSLPGSRPGDKVKISLHDYKGRNYL